MNIGIIGCGYVGLSNAIILAFKESVSLWDIDSSKLEIIKKGKSPFEDQGIIEVFSKNKIGFSFYNDFNSFIDNVDIFVLALPTDYDIKNECLNTDSIEESIVLILNRARKRKIKIIIKSTVPIGFTEKMRELYNFDNIFFIPEFLREGKAFEDVIHPERVVIGGEKEAIEEFVRVYISAIACFGWTETVVQYVYPTEAEAIKLFSNAYLAMRVAFFNELDMYAEKNKIRTFKLIEGVCSDFRIGDYYNKPSFGYGGYCLPKDTAQLSKILKDDAILIPAIEQSNRKRKKYVVDKIKNIQGNIGIYRLKSKKDLESIRNSVMLDIINRLIEVGKNIYIYEPLIKDKKIEVFGQITLVDSIEELDNKCTVIIANYMTDELLPYEKKIYTRDVF